MRPCGNLLDATPRIVPAFSVGAISGPSSFASPTIEKMMELCGDIRDQGSTSTCVWQAKCRALDLTAKLAGIDQPWFSVSLGYRLTKAALRPDYRLPIVDDGCPSGVAATVASTFGLVPESACPFDPAHVTDDPDFNLAVQAASHLQTGEYAITGDRISGLKDALSIGYIPTIAIAVDDSFDNTTYGQVVGAPTSKIRGWHDIAVIGNVCDQFLIVNSWGPDWGQNGFAWLDSSRINHETTRDLYVTTCAPKV